MGRPGPCHQLTLAHATGQATRRSKATLFSKTAYSEQTPAALCFAGGFQVFSNTLDLKTVSSILKFNACPPSQFCP